MPSGRRRWSRTTAIRCSPFGIPVAPPVRASGARQAPAIVTRMGRDRLRARSPQAIERGPKAAHITEISTSSASCSAAELRKSFKSCGFQAIHQVGLEEPPTWEWTCCDGSRRYDPASGEGGATRCGQELLYPSTSTPADGSTGRARPGGVVLCHIRCSTANRSRCERQQGNRATGRGRHPAGKCSDTAHGSRRGTCTAQRWVFRRHRRLGRFGDSAANGARAAGGAVRPWRRSFSRAAPNNSGWSTMAVSPMLASA